MLFSVFKDLAEKFSVDDVELLENIIAKAEVYAEIEAYERLLSAIENYEGENIPKDLLVKALNEEIRMREAILTRLLDKGAIELMFERKPKITGAIEGDKQ